MEQTCLYEWHEVILKALSICIVLYTTILLAKKQAPILVEEKIQQYGNQCMKSKNKANFRNNVLTR